MTATHDIGPNQRRTAKFRSACASAIVVTSANGLRACTSATVTTARRRCANVPRTAGVDVDDDEGRQLRDRVEPEPVRVRLECFEQDVHEHDHGDVAGEQQHGARRQLRWPPTGPPSNWV